MSTSLPSLVRLQRSPLTHLIARTLVLTLLSWSLPFDAALPRGAAAREEVPRSRGAAPAGVAAVVLHVNGNAAAACNGETPCFTTIQGAIDAVGRGQRIEIQAGTYDEQLDVLRKNADAAATEADRIVIEADPSSPPGSVILGGRRGRCESGYAIEIARSRYVTIRGLTVAGAGGRGIGLRGGSLENTGIHLERNRIGRGGPSECNGGIDVGRGNPQTVIANNLIHGNGRNGIRFRDGRGGSYYVVGNTIARNAWSGIQITHAATVEIVNNVIVANGTVPGAPRARVGVRRLKTSPSPASQVRMVGNLVCGNAGGEFAGPLLDASDADNLTPTGAEGPGVAPSAACGELTALFADPDGDDDVADTIDDDFHLVPDAPAVDAGADPRTLGYPAPDAVFEADFDGANARPRDGGGGDGARFDAGAHERAGDPQASPTRTPTSTPGPTPTITSTPEPTVAPTATPVPTAEPTPTTGPTTAPTASPEPTAEPTPTTPPEPCNQCAVCDTGLAGICSTGRTFCDGPFAEPECRTKTEPRSEACGNLVDEDCDGVVDEGGVPEQLPTAPPRTGPFVEPLGTSITFLQNGGSAIGLASGDFDRDGVVDLAVTEDAGIFNGRRVSIVLGNGDGTFGPPAYLVLPPNVSTNAVLAHDFDRDGLLDLLVPWFELRQVAFYRGNGDGTFAAPVPSDVAIRVTQIQVADLNCDGVLDLASIGEGVNATVAIGKGDGTFAAATPYAFNNNLVDLALADVNGDTEPDLVVGSHEYLPLTGIGVRLNDGTGSFGDLIHTRGTTLPDRFGNIGSAQVFGIQVADFDSDGTTDAAVSTQGPVGCFTFYKGNGDGTFSPPDYFEGLPDLDPAWSCVGGGNLMRRYTDNVAPDVNADGKPDVLFTYGSDDNRVVIGLGRGDGTFEPSVFAASAGTGAPGSPTFPRADGAGVASAIVTDVNGDCMLDVVTAGFQTNASQGRMGVLLARAPGDFHAPRIAPLLRDPSGDNGHQTERGVAVGDFDKDGNPDFAAGVGRAFFTVPGFGIGIDVFEGDGAGRGHALPITLNNYAGTGAAFLRAADFDQDGFLDLVFQGGDGPFGARQSVSTVFGAGDFTFGDRQSAWSPRLDANQTNIRNLIVADLDDDDDPDVAALEDDGYGTKVITTFRNQRTRTPLQFVAEVSVGSGSNGRGLVAADFDGDDKLDLVAQDSGANPQRLRLFKGNGDLTFQPGVSILEWLNQGAASAEDLAAADLDEDGDQDLVWAQYFHGCAYVLLGHDDGTFDDPVCYPVPTGRTSRLAIADFDVDGALDIVVGTDDGGMYFVRGRGDGTFENGQPYAIGKHTTEVVNVADFDRDGRPDLLWSFNNGNFGHSIVLSNATGAVPTPTPAPTATLPPGVTHTPRPTPTPTPTPRPTGTPPEGLASIVVEPVGPIILAGETQQLTATGVLDDGTSVDLTAAVAWSSAAPSVASIDASGLATGVSGGTSVVTAAIGSFSGTSALTVGARVAGDTVDPIAEIASPTDDQDVTAPIDVVGTATDSNFLKYELAFAPAGETTFTLVATGASPVAGGVLGKLDPTQLLNDIYTLRLTVFDRGGNQTTAEVTVQVDRDMKIGNYTVAFEDLSIPLAGIPILVLRIYDSRDKRSRDFGFGWHLEIQSLRVRPNRVQGLGWQVNQSGLNYQLQEIGAHKVSVTLGDGKVEEFDFRPSPTSSFLVPFDGLTVSYQPRFGTEGTLEPLGTTSLIVLDGQPGPVELLDDTTFLPYDPQEFRYTDREGRKYLLSRTEGVKRIDDPNGNNLTISAAGITHSSGASVAFARDGAGRITQIVDPKGQSQSYGYDGNGNLVLHTDPLTNPTRFKYDRRHGLLEILDPLGRRPVRNEYDEEGRLVAHIDSDGRRIEYTHDIGAGEEIITDRTGDPTIYRYDAAGNILSITDALGGTTSMTHDAAGRVLSETDPLGHQKAQTYDASGRLETFTDQLGKTTTLSYGPAGDLTSIVDALGNGVGNGFDAQHNRTSYENPLGHLTTATYDPRGELASVTDPIGRSTVFARDASGRLTSITDPAGNTTDVTHDANGNVITSTVHWTDGAGVAHANLTQSFYDARNRLVRRVDPDGAEVKLEYDAAGRVTASVDRNGARTEVSRDALGRVLSVRYADGTTESYTYDGDGNRLTATDRAGRTTSFTYDALSRRTRTTFPGGSHVDQEYDGAGRIIAMTDENGHRRTFEHDDTGRKTAEIDALGNRTEFTYDAVGAMESIVDANGATTTFERNAAGWTTRTTFADGTFVTATLGPAGQRLSQTDQEGRTTLYAYDAVGRLERVTDPLGNDTTYDYDTLGNLIRVTDALGRETTFAHDAFGRLVRHTLPLGEFEEFTYDPASRLASRTDFNGDTTTFDYDVFGRLIRATYADSSSVEYAYTATGQRASMIDSTGTTAYAYDARDRLVRIDRADGNWIVYGYDAVGNRTSVEVASGMTTYEYDAADRLVRVVDPSAGETTYEYDPVGKRIAATLPNGIRTTYDHDVLGRTTEIRHLRPDTSEIASFVHTFSASGNRTQVLESGGRQVDYTYDTLDRLTAESITDPVRGDETITYGYDAVGNRLSRSDTGGSTVYAYDDNDRLLTAGATTFTYDPNGNALTRTVGVVTTTYGYDAAGRLATLSAPGRSAGYDYDGDGVRTSALVGGSTTRFVVDTNRGLSQVLEERDAANALVARYVDGPQRIAQSRGGADSYYLHDGQLSTRALADASGTITDEYVFDAFGTEIDAAGATVNPYRFAGEQLDAESGLYHLRARQYDPTLGRFLARDPVDGDPTKPQSLNRYAYAFDNPIRWRDPSGLTGNMSELMTALQILGKTIAIQAIALGAIKLTFAFLPEDAFLADADRGLFNVSVTGRHRGGARGGGIGAGQLQFAGGVDVLLSPGQRSIAAYPYFGISATLFDTGDANAKTSAIPAFGLVWNVKQAEDYLGTFFVYSATGAGARFFIPGNIRSRLPMAPAMSIFAGPKTEGTPNPSYGFSVPFDTSALNPFKFALSGGITQYPWFAALHLRGNPQTPSFRAVGLDSLRWRPTIEELGAELDALTDPF